MNTFETDISLEDRLGMCLEHLSFLQEQLDSLADSEETPPTLTAEINSQEDVLGNIFDDRQVQISGSFSIPQTDQFGHVIGELAATGSLEGVFSGVCLVQEGTTGNTINPGHRTLGLRFSYKKIQYSSSVEESVIEYHCFAPIKTCQVSLPYNLEQEFTPADDDEFAEDVDVALLNEPMNWGDLADLVKSRFPKMNEMQRELYYEYICRTGSLPDCTLEFTSDEVKIYEASSGEQEVMHFEAPQKFKGEFIDYFVGEVEDAAGETQHLLGILCLDTDDDTVVYCYIQDLRDIHMTKSQEEIES